MSKTYLIDSENVGASWIDLLLKAEDGEFFIFYTQKSPNIDYDHVINLISSGKKPTFIPCHEGKNGLDFQLVSYLGYLLHTEDSGEMIIVSNDTGFDAVTKFWKERGQRVARKSPTDLLKKAKKEESVLVSDDSDDNAETSPVLPVESADPKEELNNNAEVDEKELFTIINCLGKKSYSAIHNACIHFYGTTKGEDIYKKLKADKFAAPSVSWKVTTKTKRFTDLIFKYCNPKNISVPKDFQTFVNDQILANDTQKSTKAKFLKKYPNGQSLNKILMPFYTSIIKIKK